MDTQQTTEPTYTPILTTTDMCSALAALIVAAQGCIERRGDLKTAAETYETAMKIARCLPNMQPAIAMCETNAKSLRAMMAAQPPMPAGMAAIRASIDALFPDARRAG